MKFKLNRTALLKSLCLIILLVGIAFGGAELIFLVDLGGIDYAVTFLLLYFASIRDSIIYKFQALKLGVLKLIDFLSVLYMFKPKVFLSHTAASGIFVTLTCSVFLVCLLWLPVMYVSAGLIT